MLAPQNAHYSIGDHWSHNAQNLKGIKSQYIKGKMCFHLWSLEIKS